MNYLFVIPALNAGGAERVLVTLANELVSLDNKVTIVTLNSSKSFYAMSPKVQTIGLNISAPANKYLRLVSLPIIEIKRMLRLKRIIKEVKPNLILSFLFTTNILAILLSFKNKVPLIVSERNDPYSYNSFIRCLIKFLYPKASGIVCQSEVVAKFFSTEKSKDIHIIPNPINKNAISTREVLLTQKKIVGVGRLIPQKNFNLLIDAFYEISDDYIDYTLEIYGEGYLKNELQKKINDLNLKNRVILCGEKKDVMKSIDDSELFVMTSNFEGFPNALIEAMASGLPVISTDFRSGVAREYIINYRNGFVIPTNNTTELKKAIIKILSNESLRKEMSINNRKIMNSLDVEQITESWVKVFNMYESRKLNEK